MISDAKNKELRICPIKRSYYQEKILLRFFSGKILGGTICQAFHFLVIVSLSEEHGGITVLFGNFPRLPRSLGWARLQCL